MMMPSLGFMLFSPDFGKLFRYVEPLFRLI